MANGNHPGLQCLGCQNGTPTAGPRVCPACGHVFRGNGWDGIDSHWRAQHEGNMSYEQFWDSLCDDHRGGADAEPGAAADGAGR